MKCGHNNDRIMSPHNPTEYKSLCKNMGDYGVVVVAVVDVVLVADVVLAAMVELFST